MRSVETVSEAIFTAFCKEHALDWRRVPAGAGKTPDFMVRMGRMPVAVEIKQIETAAGFNPHGVSSRKVGAEIRKRMDEARGQMQSAAKDGCPAVLLIHNKVDSWQIFGTEPHDFIGAMYGDLKISILANRLGPLYREGNDRLRQDRNTSFSAVGHLLHYCSGIRVVLYENVHAAKPLPFEDVPACIEVVRMQLQKL